MFKASKKSVLVIYSILSTFLTYIPMAYAQSAYQDLQTTFGSVGEILYNIIFGLATGIDWVNKALGDSVAGPIIVRVVIGVIIAMVLYLGTSKVSVFKGNEKSAKVISVLIAILSASLMPGDIVTGVQKNLLLFIIPTLILILARGKSKLAHAARGACFLALGFAIMGIKVPAGPLGMIVNLLSAVFILTGAYDFFIKGLFTGAKLPEAGNLGENLGRINTSPGRFWKGWKKGSKPEDETQQPTGTPQGELDPNVAREIQNRLKTVIGNAVIVARDTTSLLQELETIRGLI